MARRAIVFVFLFASVSVGAQSQDKVIVKSPKSTATVIVKESGPLMTTLHVTLTTEGKTASWRYNGYKLDPEETGNPAAEIVDSPQGSFLFVHGYSGGASCCWSLLAFDAGRLKALGEQLPSRSPIELVKAEPGCVLAAKAEPVDAATGANPGPGKSLFCFDGKTFSKAAHER